MANSKRTATMLLLSLTLSNCSTPQPACMLPDAPTFQTAGPNMQQLMEQALASPQIGSATSQPNAKPTAAK